MREGVRGHACRSTRTHTCGVCGHILVSRACSSERSFCGIRQHASAYVSVFVNSDSSGSSCVVVCGHILVSRACSRGSSCPGPQQGTQTSPSTRRSARAKREARASRLLRVQGANCRTKMSSYPGAAADQESASKAASYVEEEEEDMRLFLCCGATLDQLLTMQ